MPNLFRCHACGWEDSLDVDAVLVCPKCKLQTSVAKHDRMNDLTADLVRIHEKYWKEFDLILLFAARGQPERKVMEIVACSTPGARDAIIGAVVDGWRARSQAPPGPVDPVPGPASGAARPGSPG